MIMNINTSLAVIVINWNTPDLVLECVEALRRTKGAVWHLYLVDNASADDSADRLCDLGEDVTFIQSPVNGGWTGGNNLGLRYALANGHSRFFMLNSDALVLPDTLRLLLEESAQKPTAVLGPVQLDTCETHYNFAGSTLDPTTGMPSLPKDVPLCSPEAAMIGDVYATSYVQGSGLLVTREHLDQLGLFDDRFYLNYDDTDFCARARAAGYEVLLVKAARLLHHSSGSIGGGGSPLNHYFITRNSLLFARQHCTFRQRKAHWKKLLREEAHSIYNRGRLKRAYAILFGRNMRQLAFRRAILDYALDRVGDCPTLIRELQASAKASRIGKSH